MSVEPNDGAAAAPDIAAESPRSPGLRESFLFDRTVIAEIQRAAREGMYDIRDNLLPPERLRLRTRHLRTWDRQPSRDAALHRSHA